MPPEIGPSFTAVMFIVVLPLLFNELFGSLTTHTMSQLVFAPKFVGLSLDEENATVASTF